MVRKRCKERICENNCKSSLNILQTSPASQLEADYIYNLMTHEKNGLNVGANLITFTNKLIPTQDPLVTLQQLRFAEVEPIYPLPIKKINVVNSSALEELHAFMPMHFSTLPQCNLAFSCNSFANVFKDKEYTQNGHNDNDYEYKITTDDFFLDNNFAMNPIQAGKWFPGMYTIYPD